MENKTMNPCYVAQTVLELIMCNFGITSILSASDVFRWKGTIAEVPCLCTCTVQHLCINAMKYDLSPVFTPGISRETCDNNIPIYGAISFT